MLGFAPISGQSISGSPFSLVSIAAPMAAAISLSFAVSGKPGVFQPMSAGIQVAFALGGPMKVNQAISANVGVSFAFHGLLIVAGKPMKFAAISESFDFRAANENWVLKALPQDFNARVQ